MSKQTFHIFFFLIFTSFIGASQVDDQNQSEHQKVDEIMSRQLEAGLAYENGALSIYTKKRKSEYACDFRIQSGEKASSCESLDSVLKEIKFVGRRSFKFDGWYEGDLTYDKTFPKYFDIPKDNKKKGWYLTNNISNFNIKEIYTDDRQEGDVTCSHRESGSDKILYFFEDETNLITPSKYDRKYDREIITKGNYSSFYKNGKKRVRNKYEVEKNVFLKNNSLRSNIDCEIEVTVYGTFTKWYESGRKFFEVVYDETYIKHHIVNEVKHQDETVEDGKLKGTYTAWHENGVLMCKGALKNGKREGAWDFYDVNGILVEKVKYLNGKIKGEYLSFHDNGNKREKVIYYNDYKVGLGYVYHANGEVYKKTEYARGDKFGLYQEYDREGNIMVNGYYNQNVKTDKWESYYNSGKLREVKFFKKGLLHGLRNKFHPTGTKSYEVNFEYDKEEGEYTTWFKNGNKSFWGKFHNGLKNGSWFKFFKSGVKSEIVNYALVDNERNKALSSWYENYELKTEKHLRNGLWVRYHSNGKKSFEGNFTNGVLDGQQVYFDTTGVVVKKEIYIAGSRQGDIQKYHPNGTIRMKGNYSDDVNLAIESYFTDRGVQTIIAGKGYIDSEKNGYKKKINYDYGSPHGEWTSWYPSGEVLEQGVFERGEETGMYKQFNKDGSFLFEGEYVNGIEEGHWKEYSKKGVLLAKGKYENGEKVGMWMYYYKNGAPKEKIEYAENGVELVWEFWTIQGDQKVVEGSGEYISRDAAGVKIKGLLRKGLKEGTWKLAKQVEDLDYLIVFKHGVEVGN